MGQVYFKVAVRNTMTAVDMIKVIERQFTEGFKTKMDTFY